MLISTERGAAEIVSADGNTRFYDDVGCMAADWHAHSNAGRAFVRLADGTWMSAAAAVYTKPAGARTAMGSGLVAFATPDAARGPSDATIMSFDDVVRSAGELR